MHSHKLYYNGVYEYLGFAKNTKEQRNNFSALSIFLQKDTITNL